MYLMYVELESELLEFEQHSDSDYGHTLLQSSQTQRHEDVQYNEEDASDPPVTESDAPVPEPEPTIEQEPNEPVRMDLEAMYEETLIDTKSALIAKGEYYTSVECKSCQIIFNDNYGFRRHLHHVHPHDCDQTVASNEDIPQENSNIGRRSLRSRFIPAQSPSPPKALHKKNPKCNVKFKRQFRANLKLKHLKTIPLPEIYEKPEVDIQCRFCKKGGWKESEYRVHLLQRHSRQLNPLSKQIADSNSERLKETEATTSSTAANNTTSTSNRPSTATNDSPTTADPDIIMSDIPYDPIKDISENQRRTYQFFQNYMLDISWIIFAKWTLVNV